ncbi:MAG: excinuclease ABC subunit UvrC [bacterium]
MKPEVGGRGREGQAGSLAEQVGRAPGGPGVYLLKDAAGKVIYVGKARNLADRLRNYLAPKDDPRLAALVRAARSVETIVTRSEVEALVLEENLIKMKHPRYNVRLRDDKKFPYLKLTVREPVPRIFATRQIRRDGALLFGPYTSARELRRALKGVQRIFRLRTCRHRLPGERPSRPCLNFELGRCSGPCHDRVSAAEYRQQVEDVAGFLAGRSDELTGRLEARMQEAAREQNFERAAIVRDQLLALREIRKSQQAALPDRVARDVLGLARGERLAVVTLFRAREGRIVAREEYPIAAGAAVSDAEVLATVLRSVHSHVADLPDEVILPVPVEEPEAFEELLTERRGRRVRLVAPERGARVSLLALARANAEKALVENAPDEVVPKASRELARALGLAAVPRVIEGVDISNTQGRHAVGSVVVFRDGRPVKSEYRHFKVRTVAGPDDFAMIEEVLTRRARGLVEKGGRVPDLVLVDGGKGQLSTALAAWHRFAPDLPVLGLAKRTDTVYYLDGREVSVAARSPALVLLKRIRDESHRFAIAFHRRLRGRGMVASELDAIAGLGPARRRALVRHFGSVARLRNAGVEDIRQVPGIGPVLAEKVRRALAG